MTDDRPGIKVDPPLSRDPVTRARDRVQSIEATLVETDEVIADLEERLALQDEGVRPEDLAQARGLKRRATVRLQSARAELEALSRQHGRDPRPGTRGLGQTYERPAL
jgi:hypothetical protein